MGARRRCKIDSLIRTFGVRKHILKAPVGGFSNAVFLNYSTRFSSSAEEEVAASWPWMVVVVVAFS